MICTGLTKCDFLYIIILNHFLLMLKEIITFFLTWRINNLEVLFFNIFGRTLSIYK